MYLRDRRLTFSQIELVVNMIIMNLSFAGGSKPVMVPSAPGTIQNVFSKLFAF